MLPSSEDSEAIVANRAKRSKDSEAIVAKQAYRAKRSKGAKLPSKHSELYERSKRDSEAIEWSEAKNSLRSKRYWVLSAKQSIAKQANSSQAFYYSVEQNTYYASKASNLIKRKEILAAECSPILMCEIDF